MSVTKKTYSVGKIKQLIDLNGESTNFEVQFRIVSKNKEPFDILVVDQTTLDNNPNLEYKKADNGEISGNIVHDKNVYQNYFIIIKADQPCECEIEIVKKELPKTVVMPLQKSPMQTTKSANTFSWINIIIMVGVGVVVGILFYYMYLRNNQSENYKSRGQSPINSPRMYNQELPGSIVSPRENIVSPRGEFPTDNILAKLKSLKM